MLLWTFTKPSDLISSCNMKYVWLIIYLCPSKIMVLFTSNIEGIPLTSHSDSHDKVTSHFKERITDSGEIVLYNQI